MYINKGIMSTEGKEIGTIFLEQEIPSKYETLASVGYVLVQFTYAFNYL